MSRRNSRHRGYTNRDVQSAGPGQLNLLSDPECESVSIEGVEEQATQDQSALHLSESDQAKGINLSAMADPRDDSRSMGQRLRTAREQRGWSCEEVASQLKLQARLIRRIEEDDYSGIAHAVYLRGYLTSYARLLGIPMILAEQAIAERGEQAPLVSTGRVSRSRYLLDRYSVSATYLILTALVVGPAVWLATHGGLEQNLARTVMLDAPAPSEEPVSASQDVADKLDASGQPISLLPDYQAGGTSGALALPDNNRQDAPPIIASMAPFSAVQSANPPPVSSALEATGKHSLNLKLQQASWVEVTDADGTKLEYGLLEGGTERSYSSNGSLSVRLGNAQGAEISADGKDIDLAPFRRANVANLRVFAGDQLATRVD